MKVIKKIQDLLYFPFKSKIHSEQNTQKDKGESSCK